MTPTDDEIRAVWNRTQDPVETVRAFVAAQGQEPVAWIEAEPTARKATVTEIVRGLVFSTRWHYGPERPTPMQATNVLIPLYASPPVGQEPTEDEITAALKAHCLMADSGDARRDMQRALTGFLAGRAAMSATRKETPK